MNRLERAERLKRARLAQGLTQQDIASLLYKSLSTIKKWESPTGAEPSNLDDVIRLCEAYGVSVEWYLCGTHNRSRPLTTQQEQLVSHFGRLSPSMKKRMGRIIKLLAKEEH